MLRLGRLVPGLRWTFFSGALVLLLADVALVRQNADLRREIAGSGGPLAPPVGRRVPPLHGMDFAGRYLSVSYDAGQKATVVFIFSRQCGICDRTWPEWQRLLGKVDTSRIRPVFVSTTAGATESFVDDHGIARFPVFRELDPADLVALNIQLTPEVLEISADGVVEGAWIGGLDRRGLASLGQALGVPSLIGSGSRSSGRAAGQVQSDFVPEPPAVNPGVSEVKLKQ